jgi:predicted RNase H-like nuclease (RuvC/YqgF family)
MSERELFEQVYRLETENDKLVSRISELTNHVEWLEGDRVSLRQHQAGMVDAGLLQEAEREIERLRVELDTLRHDIGSCREKIALLEAMVRTYERQMGRDQ